MTNHSLAIVFPGQGSQSIGMLGDIAAHHPEVKETFDQASGVLAYDLWKLVQEGPASELDKTVHTQPALLTAAYAIWRIIQKRGSVTPSFFAGHSLGEYTALVCADAISFTDAVKVVAARGRYMQEAVREGTGAMAALIGLDENAVNTICNEARQSDDEILSPANFNSIGQIVIAGHKQAVERAMVLAKTHGAKIAMLIPVSVPSHCQLMQPAAERLKELLASIALHVPRLPVINNVDVKAYDTVDSIRDGLVRQLYKPVQWVATIEYFVGVGVTQIIECGPGKILQGLMKRINKDLQLMTTADLPSLDSFKIGK